MDIISLRNFYKSIWTGIVNNFTVTDISALTINKKIIDILFKKFGFNFTQIDLNLFMAIENDNHHIIKVNDDESFDYTMFTRIERHDDSCTYVNNTLHSRFFL